MNIKETFLKLTSKTYPYGFEDELVHFLPKGYFKDIHGNYFYKIGNSKTAFTSHLDTACKEQVNVNHVFEGNIIKTDGTSILGADDKAGVTILLYMIEKKVPGLYCFFIGEEVGCIGSELAAKDGSFKYYNRMISFDRRGTTSVITHQSSKRCCSDEFAKELAKQLNYSGLKMELDDTGVYTDSAEFVKVIPECTNISVGYYSEHTHAERQDINHLIELCKAVVKVNWESLPTKRDTKKVEYKSYSYSRYKSKGYKNYNSNNKSTGWYDDNYQYVGTRTDYTDYTDLDYDDDYIWRDEVEYPQNITKIDTSKKGRSYWEDLDNEIFGSDDDLNFEPKSKSTKKDKSYYEVMKQMIFEDDITKEEFETLTSMYLDLDDPQDMDFYLDIKDEF